MSCGLSQILDTQKARHNGGYGWWFESADQQQMDCLIGGDRLERPRRHH